MDEERRARRLGKVSQLLKEEIGKIILKDLDLDKNILVTITRVDTSSDLAHATAFFSTLARDKEEEALAALTQSVFDIQHVLNRKLRMRPVPKIRFAIDASFKKEQRLYDILSTSHDEKI